MADKYKNTILEGFKHYTDDELSEMELKKDHDEIEEIIRRENKDTLEFEYCRNCQFSNLAMYTEPCCFCVPNKYCEKRPERILEEFCKKNFPNLKVKVTRIDK